MKCLICANDITQKHKKKYCSLKCSALARAKQREKYIKDYYQLNKDSLKEKSASWYEKNKERAAEAAKIYRQRNKEQISEAKLLYKFGLSLSQYNSMLEEQGYVCAICGKACRDKRARRLAVDHCHLTGKIRGLLCSPCNQALGLFKDNTNILISAINYLEKHNE